MDVNFFTEEWLSWSKASDLKSEVGDELTVGSNPTSSAILRVSARAGELEQTVNLSPVG